MRLRAGLATLAERLTDAGDQTAGFSENPLVSDLSGSEKGFEQFAARSVAEATNEENDPGSSPFDILGEVTAFAAKRDGERPFFVFINLFDPHTAYLVREENRFVDPDVSVVDSWMPGDLKNTAYRICDRVPSAEDLKILHGSYLGDVAESDTKFGKIEAIAREAAGAGPRPSRSAHSRTGSHRRPRSRARMHATRRGFDSDRRALARGSAPGRRRLSRKRPSSPWI